MWGFFSIFVHIFRPVVNNTFFSLKLCLEYFCHFLVNFARNGRKNLHIFGLFSSTFGDFLQHAVTQAIDNALEDDVTMRSGLPINFLKYLGTGYNMSKYIESDESGDSKAKKLPSNETEEKVLEFKENVKKHLSKLIDHIDVNTAADAMSADFMASRLPPYGHVVAEGMSTFPRQM